MKNMNNIINSNEYISNLIKHGGPFSIVRLGMGSEAYKTFEYIKTGIMNTKFLHPVYHTLYNAGIYTSDKDLEKIRLYLIEYDKAVKNSDCIASFQNHNKLGVIQDYYSKTYQLPQIHSRSLEPFYASLENQKPWTHHLLGKKVLIVNPFVKSFEKQMMNKFRIFKDDDKRIFLEGQEFEYYKSYQTIAGNHIHNDWIETFDIMCNDIKELDFDIALLGCGGYGLPLCNYIKTELNKSAVYIGGGLQLLFGVMGKRWENNEMWKQIIKYNDCKFIRPSEDELCPNLKTIEGGCYW